MGDMTGEKREGKGRDCKNPSLSLPPLYKGVSGDLGRDGAKTASSLFFYENCHPNIAKSGARV
jgi:hypothetical protein